MLIEATDFQFLGAWHQDSTGRTLAGMDLAISSGEGDATTVVDVARPGAYHVWVRSKDFTTSPGTRRFQLALDGDLFPVEFGSNAHGDWWWDKAGDVTLTAGKHVLQLHDLTLWARCDSIFMSPDDADPNTLTFDKLAKYKLLPIIVTPKSPASPSSASRADTSATTTAARLQGRDVRFLFRQMAPANGTTHVVYDIYCRTPSGWQRVPLAEQGGRLTLCHRMSSPPADVSNMNPTWANSRASYLQFDVGAKTYTLKSNTGDDPFTAGDADDLTPFEARQVDSQSVTVKYISQKGAIVMSQWSIDPDSDDARVSVRFTAPADGDYSVAFSPFTGLSETAVKYDLLPPLYQSLRRPAGPKLLPNTCTPHALALVQIALGPEQYSASLAIQAEPNDLPFQWPMQNNADCGFSILGPDSTWQPTEFAPILGYAASTMKSGQQKTVRFRVLVTPGDWKQGLEYSSSQIDKVTDYRKPYRTSLTQAAFNIMDLLKNDSTCGWDPHLKGFYNIESEDTATQSAPLPLIGASVLSNDEELYAAKALPSIEFALTRPWCQFADHLVAGSPYIAPWMTQVEIPSRFFGTSFWQGAYSLLGDSNTWMQDIALDKGAVRFSAGYSSLPHWSESLAGYRLNPSPSLLGSVCSEADSWIAKEIATPKTKDLGLMPFYNVAFYPYWWDLPDLYELTGDKRYLSAAEEGAFGTIAGLWSHPSPPAGDVTVNDDRAFSANYLYWKGPGKYRLGYPRKPDEKLIHQAPAWLVADEGMGLEQPWTCYSAIAYVYHLAGTAPLGHISATAWAPSLLRLYGMTGRDIYLTYARNAIMSRFANYPGYGVSNYTDLPQTPAYPYTGPDMTYFCYHHIPEYLAFSLDFLVTEAEVRSHGAIKFPWVRSQGFVWFSTRVYGNLPGKVFGDTSARLSFDRKLAHVDSPAIDYVMARSTNRFWIVLMNESDQQQKTTVLLDRERLGIARGTTFLVTDAAGKSRSLVGVQPDVNIPAKGLVAMSIATKSSKPYPVIPRLLGGRASAHIGGDWGDAQAFRIRSPFGKDALYVVLTGHPADGAIATLTAAGQTDPITVKQFPYEFNIYPLPMDKDIQFSLALRGANGAATNMQPLTLTGK